MWLTILFLVLPIIFYIAKYSSSVEVKNYDKIRKDAEIIDIFHEKVRKGRRDTLIKTIVRFDDGVEYHTFKSRGEPDFGYIRVVVDEDVMDEIIEKAIKAHSKLAAKYDKNP